MFTNADCTVYHKVVNKLKRIAEYEKHIIKNVYWENSAGQSKGKTEMITSNNALIIIPKSSISDFIPCKDDIIAKGIYTDDLPTSDFQQLETVHTIMSVADFRYGSSSVQHFEVTAI